MKKQLLLIAMVLVSTLTYAQEYKKWKVGFGIGYTMPKGGGGILVDLEPAYRVNDQISVGLRMESAAMAREINGTTGSISANGSYTINGQYYFSNAKFRPYAGLGVGVFSLASVSVGNSGASAEAGSQVGFYPRVGFDLGHFNLNLDYNIIGNSEGVVVGVGDAPEIKNSYLGIRLGFFVGGGKN